MKISAHILGVLCGKNMLEICCVHMSYDGYIAMVKDQNECQPSDYMLFVGILAIEVCCAEVLFQPSFLCITQRAAWCVACGREREAYHGT